MIPIHRYWLLVMAVVLAALIGPPTHAQPPIESSFGRGDVPPIVGMTGESFTIRVRQEDTVDLRGMVFFEIQTQPEGRITVIADSDLPLARALQKVAGKRARLSLEVLELQQLEGR